MLGLGFAKTGIKTDVVLEEVRLKLVNGVKSGGNTFAFDMGSTAPDFAKVLFDGQSPPSSCSTTAP